MSAVFPRQRLILSLPATLASAAGVATAAIFALIPAQSLELMVVQSGAPALLTAAEPPLGITARLVLMILFGGGVALFVWLGLSLAMGERTIRVSGRERPRGTMVLRRADAHPDAPAREPLFAHRDLGTPFLEVCAKEDMMADHMPVIEHQPIFLAEDARPIPDDLDIPMAAYAMSALRGEPVHGHAEAAVTPAPTRPQIFEANERFETFALPRSATITAWRASPTPRIRRDIERSADSHATINALLDRLERGVSQRDPAHLAQQARNDDVVHDALDTLRGLASRAG